MAGQIVLRFYGRVVMAAPQSTGSLVPTFLMPDMQFSDASNEQHRPLMTIGRRHVEVAQTGQTTLKPSYRVMAGAPIRDAEQLVWDLRGYTVDAGGSGGVAVTYDSGLELIDLSQLEAIKSRPTTFNQASLQGSTSGPVRAAIRVGGGAARAYSASRPMANEYVDLDAARANAAGTGPAPIVRRPAALDIDIIDVTLTGLSRLTLALSPSTGAGKQVTVVSDGVTDTIIGFSNLCVCLPKDYPRFDFEFAQYYNLLTYGAGVPADVLIPGLPPASLGYEDCDNMAQIRY
ncbi:MAG: hypothetical protein ABL986_16805 [Vicinamibacterales bacterium]